MLDHTTGLEKQVRTLRKRSIFTLFLTWLALFFTVIGIAAGYKNFLRVHDKAKEARDEAKVAMSLMPQMANKRSIDEWQMEVRSQLLANQLQASKELSELRTLRNKNTYTESALQQQVEALTRQQEVASLNPSAGMSNDPWQLSSVRHLLKTASMHLSLNQDVTTAVTALKAADWELIELGMSRLLPIRNLIAKDIASLEAYQAIDIANVIGLIDDLALRLQPKQVQSIAKLSAAAEGEKSDAVVEESEVSDSILDRMKSRFDETVVIKRYDNELAKTIRGDTQQVRYELVRLKLETLKLLALKSQEGLFQNQLKQLTSLLKNEHIDLVDNSALVALARLESVELSPELPRLLSVELFDEWVLNAAEQGSEE